MLKKQTPARLFSNRTEKNCIAYQFVAGTEASLKVWTINIKERLMLKRRKGSVVFAVKQFAEAGVGEGWGVE